MAKTYRVSLTDEERQDLHTLITKRSPKSIQVKRAYILLAADDAGEKCWQDTQIHTTYHMSIRSIERVRRRFVEEGYQVALHGKKREVFKEKVFTGDVEARLIALRCSEPPSGRSRWTLELLADKMVELRYVEAMSYESVRQLLKKTR